VVRITGFFDAPFAYNGAEPVIHGSTAFRGLEYGDGTSNLLTVGL